MTAAASHGVPHQCTPTRPPSTTSPQGLPAPPCRHHGHTYQAALRRGASAAAAWDEPLDVVLDVLGAALAGRVLIPFEVAATLGLPAAQPDPARFTSEELGWLRMLAAGATATALAEQSGLSNRTMYRRLADLYTRLGVHNRAEAITTATRWGLLDT